MTNIQKISPPKVALVYDWLDTNYGGAEKVLLALNELYPDATLFTSYANYKKINWLNKFKKIQTTFIQKFPQIIKKNKAIISLFMPYAFESLNLESYNLIISVTSFAAKGIITSPNQIHICYLLTPTRFLYSHTNSYLSPINKFLSYPLFKYLTNWDQVAISRPDYLIAISNLVAQRCQKFYHRCADKVIYPTILPASPTVKEIKKENYYLVISRLVKYKKIISVIQACGQLQFPLKIIGTGPELSSLKKVVKKNSWQGLIEFLGNQNEVNTQKYLQTAKALIAPGLEDFGINLLEANKMNTIVISHPKSGAKELLKSEMAIDIPTDDLKGLIKALKQAQKAPIIHIPSQLADTKTFLNEFSEYINYLYCTI